MWCKCPLIVKTLTNLFIVLSGHIFLTFFSWAIYNLIQFELLRTLLNCDLFKMKDTARKKTLHQPVEMLNTPPGTDNDQLFTSEDLGWTMSSSQPPYSAAPVRGAEGLATHGETLATVINYAMRTPVTTYSFSRTRTKWSIHVWRGRDVPPGPPPLHRHFPLPAPQPHPALIPELTPEWTHASSEIPFRILPFHVPRAPGHHLLRGREAPARCDQPPWGRPRPVETPPPTKWSELGTHCVRHQVVARLPEQPGDQHALSSGARHLLHLLHPVVSHHPGQPLPPGADSLQRPASTDLWPLSFVTQKICLSKFFLLSSRTGSRSRVSRRELCPREML